jgi:CRP-like cAMP-binding protein
MVYSGSYQSATGDHASESGDFVMKLLELFQDWPDLVEFKSGTVIFRENEPADVMYVILSGEVELSLHNEPLGSEMMGGLVGEMAMIGRAVRSATATTLNKVKAAQLNPEQFRTLVRENGDFALHVMAVLANRLRAANELITR